MRKSTFILWVAIAFAVGVIGSYVLFDKSSQNASATSPTGTTNSQAFRPTINWSPSTASATSTTISNNSGFDWAILDSFTHCTGVGTSLTAYTGAGLASLVIKGATTSSTITGNLADYNTNYGTNMTLPTTTTDDFVSTSTEGVIAGTSRIVANGASYTFSANATNTASCVSGLDVVKR